ncbi:MAG TPA: amidohydrolase family protein, partial [Acidimicrobiales bacterium]|nr:amidohydrolase family protein [Acidimicrobiales bacterium]
MSHDLVVRGGTLVDGSGRPRYRGDVGIDGDTVTALGRVDGRGTVEIDAEGCMVAPGFVDGHTHMDAQVHWDPLATCPSLHGVTSLVMGNCGFTLAPCRATEIDLVLRSLERAEDIAREAMLAGIEWAWETFPEFLDHLERLPKAVNYAGYVGHSALRTYVMGERAYEGPATEEDLAAMAAQLRQSVLAGAVGLSTSCSSNHETADDRPVASRLADWSELVALVGVLTELDAGVFQLAPARTADALEHDRFAERLEALAVDCGRPVTFMVGGDGRLLDLLDRVADRGGELIGQVHSREYLNVMGFAVGLPFDRLAGWAELRARPLAEQAAALADPDRRARLVDEALHGSYGRQVGPVRAPTYDQIRVFDSPDGPYTTVGQLAQARGTTPVDVMIDLSVASGFEQLFAQPIMGSTMEDALTGLRHPHTVVAASDSGAHVTQIVDSS